MSIFMSIFMLFFHLIHKLIFYALFKLQKFEFKQLIDDITINL